MFAFQWKGLSSCALDDYPWDQTMKNSVLGPLFLYVFNKEATICVYVLI